jgi:hypothetical protein
MCNPKLKHIKIDKCNKTKRILSSQLKITKKTNKMEKMEKIINRRSLKVLVEMTDHHNATRRRHSHSHSHSLNKEFNSNIIGKPHNSN